MSVDELSRAAAEEWRPVVGLEGRYEVSSLGRVRSVYRNCGHGVVERIPPLIRRPHSNRAGYPCVTLMSQSRLIHRLVLEAFVGPCPAGKEGGHLNGQRTDNRPGNLAWITPSENQQHRFLHGTDSSGERHYSRARPDRIARGDRSAARLHPESLRRGEAHHRAKLTDDAVRAIRQHADDGTTQSALAAQYGVSQTRISAIVRRASWRHVSDGVPTGVPT